MAGADESNEAWVYGTYATYASTTSYTWAGAHNRALFANRYSGRTYMLTNVWDMASADVLQLDFDRNNNIDHTMIVTWRDSNERYLTYHSDSTHNKRLSTIIAQNPNALYYAHGNVTS